MPTHYPAYLKILPVGLKRTSWLSRFDVTGIPVEQVAVGSKVYFAGAICKPHDCASDQSRAAAMVKAGETGGQITELGHPTPAERQLMAQEFQD
jgi:hypothetical protein